MVPIDLDISDDQIEDWLHSETEDEIPDDEGFRFDPSSNYDDGGDVDPFGDSGSDFG
jgi:hypothetical protein